MVAGKPIDQAFSMLDGDTREILAKPIDDIIEAGAHSTTANSTILVSRDGTERLIACSVAPICKHEGKIIGGELLFRDITKKRRMQEELLRVEKLESICVLTGGIAPDFYNILTAYLPASDQEFFHTPEVENKIVQGAGRILIMDEDETIHDVVGAMLRNAGYDVTFFESFGLRGGVSKPFRFEDLGRVVDYILR